MSKPSRAGEDQDERDRRDRFVPLAEVMRPHGVHGELRLKVFNSESDLLLAQDEVLVQLKPAAEAKPGAQKASKTGEGTGAQDGGDVHEVSVDRARRADAAILLKLHSIDDRDRAEELRGALVGLWRSQFPPPEEGAFYACDIEGARVVVREAAEDGSEQLREIGTVRSLTSYPSVDVLVVHANDGKKDWEVPLVEAYVSEVDVARGLVTLATLEGLER
ncbi:ribosome maturation factor RimM [Pendulispora albinea]|uniref:Ribosome maturation factor RimM n=1 Tax=Pendulispora albinea TaxID=2741071 RepID=A0ABZ2LNR4_9BACT